MVEELYDDDNENVHGHDSDSNPGANPGLFTGQEVINISSVGSGWVESAQEVFEISRVGSGSLGSNLLRRSSKSHASGRGRVQVTRPDPSRPDPRGLTQPVNSPEKTDRDTDSTTGGSLLEQ